MRRLLLKHGSPRKSQAVSELAIFGALIIAAFAAVLSYLQSMNSQQALQMKAFRMAFKLSRQLDKEVAYTIIRDTPVVDLGDLFGRPDISRMTASSDVVAMIKDPPPKNIRDRDIAEYYEINGQVYEVNPIKVRITYEEGDRDLWVSAPISDVEYAATKQRRGSLTKNENASSITTTPSGSVTTQTTADLILKEQASFLRDCLGDIQDNVQTETWVKEIKSEHFLYNLKSWIELTLVGLLEYFVDFPSCNISKTASTGIILAGVSAIAKELFSYFLDAGDAYGDAVGVRVTEGYRDRDTISGSKTFNLPQQPFTVSQ